MTEGDRARNSIADAPSGFVREIYEEYDVGSIRVGMIADPENEHAWIQSDHTVQIEP